MESCREWFYTVLALIGLFFVWSIVIFRYYLKVDRKSIVLGQADKLQEQRHQQNQQKIRNLEKQIIDLKTIILEKNKNERRK